MRILAKTRIGSEHMLRVFHCFDNDIYFAILFSIIAISCVTSVRKKSLRVWLNTFWSYLISLLSEHHFNYDKTLFGAFTFCPWLIGCVVLLASFAGKLREQILKGQDIHWIDSLRDLYEWEGITKLQYAEFGDFNNYLIKNDTDPLRQYLNKKNKECLTDSIREFMVSVTDPDCTQITELDYQGVMDGTTAMIFRLEFIAIVKRVLYKFNWKEDLDFHVSKSDTHSEPVFMATNKLNLEKRYEVAWDMS